MDKTGLICKKSKSLQILSASVITSFALSVVTLSSLSAEDRISAKRGSILFGLGLIFFSSLFNLLNCVSLRTLTGIQFRERFQLTIQDMLDISNKIVSAVQAVLSCVTGSTVCLYSCTRSLLSTSHFASEAYGWFGASYFFYDVWSMYKVHVSGSIALPKGRKWAQIGQYLKQRPIILFHHLFIGSFGFLVIVYLRGGLGDCVFGFVYLMELSTPFVSIRSVLSKLGLKQSKIYAINGIMMILSFFFCRVAMFPYVCYLYAQIKGMKFVEGILSLPKTCKMGIAVLLLPQIYWFYLMVKGAFNVFRPKVD